MIRIQFPELYVNDIEILVTEKVWIPVDVRLGLNIQ
jgi:hypothetical protein